MTLTTMPASSARQMASNSSWSPDEVEREDEHEDDQRGAGAGAADAGLGARVGGDRRRRRLGACSRLLALPLPCPSSLAIRPRDGAQRLDLAVADVAHQAILVGAGRRRRTGCPSGPRPRRRARRGRARSRRRRRGAGARCARRVPSGRFHLSSIRMPPPRDVERRRSRRRSARRRPRTVTSRWAATRTNSRRWMRSTSPLSVIVSEPVALGRQRAACSGGCRGPERDLDGDVVAEQPPDALVLDRQRDRDRRRRRRLLDRAPGACRRARCARSRAGRRRAVGRAGAVTRSHQGSSCWRERRRDRPGSTPVARANVGQRAAGREGELERRAGARRLVGVRERDVGRRRAARARRRARRRRRR